MAQGLGALTALASVSKDSSFHFSTHIRSLTTASDLSFRNWTHFYVLHRHLHSHMHILIIIHRHNIYT